MTKSEEIKLRISPEKKALWQEYCEVEGCGLTLSSLIEFAVDDRVCGKTKFIDTRFSAGIYWAVKPNGKRRKDYNKEVFALARKNIARKRKYREEIESWSVK